MYIDISILLSCCLIHLFDLLKSLLTPYFASVIIAQKGGYHVLDYQNMLYTVGRGGIDISNFLMLMTKI